MTTSLDNPCGGSERSSATSRSLLDRVRADDAAAWDRLVGLYAPLVFYWCRRAELQEQDAADVLQEVFLAIAKHLSGFRKERPGDTFRGWLRVITQRKILDLFRRRQREPDGVGGSVAADQLAAMPAPPGLELQSAADHRAERSLLFRSLDLLRSEFEPKTWQAFWKTVVDDRAAKEVAEELGMSPGAVRVCKSRVLHRLRRSLVIGWRESRAKKVGKRKMLPERLTRKKTKDGHCI